MKQIFSRTTIMTGIGIAAMVSGTIFAIRAAPKVAKFMDEKREERAEVNNPVQAVKFAWRYKKQVILPYIPTTAAVIVGAACIIGAQKANMKHNAALVTAYELSENALRDYRGKVIETLGEEKDDEITTAVAQDKVNTGSSENTQVIFTGGGETMCYDLMSGRYFKSSMEKLRSEINTLNERMLDDGGASLNDFYDLIGLDSIEVGDILTWEYNGADFLVRPKFSSVLTKHGEPCLTVGFYNPPQYQCHKTMRM